MFVRRRKILTVVVRTVRLRMICWRQGRHLVTVASVLKEKEFHFLCNLLNGQENVCGYQRYEPGLETRMLPTHESAS